MNGFAILLDPLRISVCKSHWRNMSWNGGEPRNPFKCSACHKLYSTSRGDCSPAKLNPCQHTMCVGCVKEKRIVDEKKTSVSQPYIVKCRTCDSLNYVPEEPKLMFCLLEMIDEMALHYNTEELAAKMNFSEMTSFKCPRCSTACGGSTSAIQILMEADESVLQKKVSFVGGGTVSEYFYNGFIGIWNGGMKNEFLQLAQKYPGYQLWITGHSLGGAMASMAASYISTVKLFETAQIRLVTYGEPRVGDADYAAAVDTLPYVFRVTHAHDIVAHIPFQNMGYVHHHTEIWYNNNMATANFKVCDGGDEDKSCSDGQLDLSIEDHLHYYGVEVHEWGTKGCV